MCWECRERFSRDRLQTKPLVSVSGMLHGTFITHVPWCMSGSLTRGGEENVPGKRPMPKIKLDLKLELQLYCIIWVQLPGPCRIIYSDGRCLDFITNNSASSLITRPTMSTLKKTARKQTLFQESCLCPYYAPNPHRTLVVLYRMFAIFTWYGMNDVWDSVSAHIYLPGMFLYTGYLYEKKNPDWTSYLGPYLYMRFTYYTKDKQQGCSRLSNSFSCWCLGPWMNTCLLHDGPHLGLFFLTVGAKVWYGEERFFSWFIAFIRVLYTSFAYYFSSQINLLSNIFYTKFFVLPVSIDVASTLYLKIISH